MTSGKAIFLFECTFSFLTFCPTRDNVERLIFQVPDARHKSFSTHEMAEEFYLGAKSLGKVRCVRNPGDDEIYGPRDEAVQ